MAALDGAPFIAHDTPAELGGAADIIAVVVEQHTSDMERRDRAT